MLIFAGIDGTGVWNDADYAKEFKNSFVNRISRQPAWGGLSHYVRGPSNDGISTIFKAGGAADFVERCYRSHMAKPEAVRPGVFLSGYSRGGAAAISAAWTLQEKGIPVDCLLLFDAVDRTVTISQTAIPPNVSDCYHAVRDPATMSRHWFSNCGRTATKATNYVERVFFCTHGGIGGLPYAKGDAAGAIDEDVDLSFTSFAHSGATNVTPAVDNAVAAQVWQWMFGCLGREIAADKQRYANARNTTTRDIELITSPGDTLSSLALRYYGDTNKWRLIHDRNRHRLEGPSEKQPMVSGGGLKLLIPDVPPGRQGDRQRNLNPRLKSARFGPQMRPE